MAGVDRSPTTVVIWLVAAALAVFAGVRLFGGGDAGSGGDAVRLDGAAARGGASRDAGAIGAGGVRGGAGGGGAAPAVVVHVAGAVHAPGLYRLTSGARVAAALERAGGPSPRADLDALNLAARVQDGQQVVVPRAGAVTRAGGGLGAAGPKPSLGSATAEQLQELDGIGPTLAERIVEYRATHGGFRSLDELAEVDGIGEQRLQALREALQP